MFPPIKEEISESVQFKPHDHGQERTVEQSVNVPVPRNKEEIAEVLQPLASEAHPKRVSE